MTNNIIFDGGAKKRKLLPELNKKVSLKKHGYRVKKSASSRQQSLRKASRAYGTLPVLRRINLIRNYSKKYKDKYKIMSNDVEYMKHQYADEKKKNKVNTKKTRKTKTKKTTKKNKK